MTILLFQSVYLIIYEDTKVIIYSMFTYCILTGRRRTKTQFLFYLTKLCWLWTIDPFLLWSNVADFIHLCWIFPMIHERVQSDKDGQAPGAVTLQSFFNKQATISGHITKYVHLNKNISRERKMCLYDFLKFCLKILWEKPMV